jgi:hypothetical protein
MVEQPAISLFGWYSLIDDNSLGFLSGEEGATKETLDNTFDKAALRTIYAQHQVSMCCATPSYFWVEL